MKKIFSKEIFLSPLFLILSFFLFSCNVNADTISVNVNSSDFDYVSSTSDFAKFKVLIEDYISNSADYNYYIIYYEEGIDSDNNPYYPTSYSNLRARLFSSIPTPVYSQYNNRFNMRFSDVCGVRVDTNSTITQLFVGGTCFPNLWININYPNNTIMMLAYLDSNFDITYTLSQDLQINSSHYSYHLEQNTIFYSLYYLYTHENEPPDSTPTLTAFYTLIIDKFSTIADFFTDNTYLFAIPLIPILILCIYLIKRSLIK